MKYKNIKSMLHNFGHSFMSLMNYVDGEYAIDLLAATLKERRQDRLEIHFPSQRIEPLADYSSRLRKSVGYRADALPGHMASHGVSLEALPEIVLVIFRDSTGMHCRVQATDDRGKTYDVRVTKTA